MSKVSNEAEYFEAVKAIAKYIRLAIEEDGEEPDTALDEWLTQVAEDIEAEMRLMDDQENQ